MATEAQYKTTYNISIVALEEAKGTLLAYDNIAVAEGPWPRKAYVQARDIQSGKFVKDWMLENRVNQTSFKAMRAKMAAHPIEDVGAKLRAMMPWIKARALVDRSRN